MHFHQSVFSDSGVLYGNFSTGQVCSEGGNSMICPHSSSKKGMLPGCCTHLGNLSRLSDTNADSWNIISTLTHFPGNIQ